MEPLENTPERGSAKGADGLNFYTNQKMSKKKRGRKKGKHVTK